MKVNVLGTDYEIEVKKRSEDSLLESSCGYTDTSVKKIVVFDPAGETDADCVADLEYHQQKVIRHEILHATLYESGLAENSDWAFKEEIVDWIAIQIPKLAKAMCSACALNITDIFDLKVVPATLASSAYIEKGAGVDG